MIAIVYENLTTFKAIFNLSPPYLLNLSSQKVIILFVIHAYISNLVVANLIVMHTIIIVIIAIKIHND